jgi:hypothetical protein
VQIIHERCAALDIGKSVLVACVRRPDEAAAVDSSKSAASPRSATSWRRYVTGWPPKA